MINEQLDDELPAKVTSLVWEIGTICHKKQLDDVIPALRVMFIHAIMTAEGCSISEAVVHARNDLNEAIARHSTRQ
jgi:hypothetical protein